MADTKYCITYDSEIFSNFYLVSFYDPQTDSHTDFVFRPGTEDTNSLQAHRAGIADYRVIGFNNLFFDNVLLAEFLKSRSVAKVKELSDGIISGQKRQWRPTTLFNDEIDVLAILDRKASLKEYQARLGLEKIVEWEGDFTKPLPADQEQDCIEYCHYDTKSTWLLYSHQSTQGKIRVKQALAGRYGLENCSMTDSDFGEQIISREIRRKLGIRANAKIPRAPKLAATGDDLLSPKLKFEGIELTDLLQSLRRHTFEYRKSSKDKLYLTSKINQEIVLPWLTLNFGLGGLHSVGIQAAIIEPKDGKLLNYDVGSYYPSTIDLLDVAPTGIENAFLGVYRPLLANRLQAKKTGDKDFAQAVKILLNAVFGRFKYKNSAFFNPVSMLQITLNCQLFYLMLIEQFNRAGIRVLQVNTDGILIYPKTKQLPQVSQITEWWEAYTGYKLDFDSLGGILLKDTNNYAWIQRGQVTKQKGKGFQTGLSLFRGCAVAPVVGQAVERFFLNQIPVEDTIEKAVTDRDWKAFAAWKCPKNKDTGKKHVIRYTFNKCSEKLPGFGDRIQLLDDANKFDWQGLNRQKYIALARQVIRDCGEKPPGDAEQIAFDFGDNDREREPEPATTTRMTAPQCWQRLFGRSK